MSTAGDETRQALLDAAERLLVEEGIVGITTRKIADRAGVNQALVHYHFGTVEQLLMDVLGRVSSSVADRAQSIYEGRGTLYERWSADTEEMLGDLSAGWPKVWLETVTLAANRPNIRQRYLESLLKSRETRRREVAAALGHASTRDRRVTANGLVSLLEAVNVKILLDHLLENSQDDRDLLDIVDYLLSLVAKPQRSRSRSLA